MTLNRLVAKVSLNMKNLLTNWKTTSAGLTVILLQVIHLAFQIKNHVADEQAWKDTALAFIVGIGLIAAGDASKSLTKDEGLTKLEGDTRFMANPNAPPKP